MTGTVGVPDPAPFLRALGKRVRLLRLTREWTQEQLGEAAGMSRSFVSLVEKGTQGIDVVRLWRFAEAFEMPLAELIAQATGAAGAASVSAGHGERHTAAT